jgi:hypothetical protein
MSLGGTHHRLNSTGITRAGYYDQSREFDFMKQFLAKEFGSLKIMHGQSIQNPLKTDEDITVTGTNILQG